jgi:hypothetical protein
LKKKTKIATHMDLWKYGQILTIQKFLVIKRLRFSKNIFFIWIYHFVPHYILNLNNKKCESIILKKICDVSLDNKSIFFNFKSPLLLTNDLFINK